MQLNRYLDIEPKPFTASEAIIKDGKVSVWVAKEVEGGGKNFEEFLLSMEQGGEFEKRFDLEAFSNDDFIRLGFVSVLPAKCCWPEGLVAYASVNRKGSVNLSK